MMQSLIKPETRRAITKLACLLRTHSDSPSAEALSKAYARGEIKKSPKEALALWRCIDAYALPFGEEYLQYKHGWSEKFGKEALREYRKFVWLAKISSSEITPSQSVDEVWHLHILHTKAYAEFSKDTGGFLHHSPGTPDASLRFVEQYKKTKDFTEEIFS